MIECWLGERGKLKLVVGWGALFNEFPPLL